MNRTLRFIGQRRPVRCEQDLRVHRAASPRLWLPTRRHRGREVRRLGSHFTLGHGTLIHPPEFHPESPAFIHRERSLTKRGWDFLWGFLWLPHLCAYGAAPGRLGFWRRFVALVCTLHRRIPSDLVGTMVPV